MINRLTETKPLSFVAILGNNLALAIIFIFSAIWPAYVWLDFPSRVSYLAQIVIGIFTVIFLNIFLYLACYVHKNIEKRKDNSIGKGVAKFYLLTGGANFLLYALHISNMQTLLPGHYLQVIILLVSGVTAFVALKKRKEKTSQTNISQTPVSNFSNTAA